MKWQLIATAAATLLFLSVVFYDTIAAILTVGAWVLVIVGVIAAIVASIGLGHLTIERMRLATIERKKAQYQTHQDGFGMVHLVNVSTGIVENLSTYPGTHHNGRWEEPHPAAAAAWFALVGKAKSESPANLLAAPQKQRLDIMEIMTQPTQSYAIIGGQQVGKTFQARRIANYWLDRDIKPMVIGPKWDHGEWTGCIKVGGKYDYDKVLVGMNAAKKLAESRHANDKLSHKQHPIQPLFFDDWTSIRANLQQDAEAFIIDATTLYASVNIILYFILHLDTANGWGVGKVGAALHQNFIKLFIEPGFNSSGIIDRTKNVGWILMAGQSKKDRQRIPLFTEYGRQPIEPDLIIPPVPRTDQQRRIVELYNSGLTDIGAIATQVYNGHGGAQYDRVRDTIERYC